MWLNTPSNAGNRIIGLARVRTAAFALEVLLNVIIAITAGLWINAAASQDWKPQRNIDIIVNSGAGGAADRQSRVVQKFLQSVPVIPSSKTLEAEMLMNEERIEQAIRQVAA